MSVKRSILHYNILRYPDTERSKIPNSLNATGNHCISNALCNFNGNSQHPYMHIVLLHFLYKFIRMKNRNAIQAGSYQSGIHIKSRYNLETEMLKTGILQQSTAQTTDPEKKSLMYICKAKKVFQYGY